LCEAAVKRITKKTVTAMKKKEPKKTVKAVKLVKKKKGTDSAILKIEQKAMNVVGPRDSAQEGAVPP